MKPKSKAPSKKPPQGSKFKSGGSSGRRTERGSMVALGPAGPKVPTHIDGSDS